MSMHKKLIVDQMMRDGCAVGGRSVMERLYDKGYSEGNEWFPHTKIVGNYTGEVEFITREAKRGVLSSSKVPWYSVALWRPRSVRDSCNTEFTQAMIDTGQLPPIGSYVCFEGENVLIQGYARSGYPIFEREDGMVDSFNEKSVYSVADTRTEMEKAFDTALLDINAKLDDVTNVGAVVSSMINAGYHK